MCSGTFKKNRVNPLSNFVCGNIRKSMTYKCKTTCCYCFCFFRRYNYSVGRLMHITKTISNGFQCPNIEQIYFNHILLLQSWLLVAVTPTHTTHTHTHARKSIEFRKDLNSKYKSFELDASI